MVSDDKYEAVNSRDWYVTRLKGENQNQSFRYDIRSCTTKEEQADGIDSDNVPHPNNGEVIVRKI